MSVEPGEQRSKSHQGPMTRSELARGVGMAA